MHLKANLAPFLTLLSVMACVTAVGPSDPDDRLETSLTVTPSRVRAGDSLTARFTVTNVGAVPITIVSGNGCTHFLHIEGASGAVVFRGSDWLCITVVTEWTIEPGSTLVAMHKLEAVLFDRRLGTWSKAPTPGVYDIKTSVLGSGLRNRNAKIEVY